MNRFKQCTYTLILLLTCLVASPKIYKEIWDSSKEKKKAENYKPPVIEISKPSSSQPEGSTDPTGEDTSSDVQQGTNDPAQQETTDNAGAETTTSGSNEPKDPSNNYPYVFVENEPSYFDDAIFIGDSRTVGLMEYGTLKNASYYCDVGFAAYKLDNGTIASVLGGKSFGKVYIMLGLNEVGNDLEYTASSFRRIVEAVRKYQPKAVIYLCANLHVTEDAQNPELGIVNGRIDELNVKIAQLADGKSIFYININPVFDDGQGNLRSDCTGDGVHVFASYYQTWCEWFCVNTIDKNTVVYYKDNE